jgi:hypothetical protein
MLYVTLVFFPYSGAAECPANLVNLRSEETGLEYSVTDVAYEVTYLCYEINVETGGFGEMFLIPPSGHFETWDSGRSRALFDQVPGIQCPKAVQVYIYRGSSNSRPYVVEHLLLDASPSVQTISFDEAEYFLRRGGQVPSEDSEPNWLTQQMWTLSIGDTAFVLEVPGRKDDWEFPKPLVDPGPLGGGAFVVTSCRSE